MNNLKIKFNNLVQEVRKSIKRDRNRNLFNNIIDNITDYEKGIIFITLIKNLGNVTTHRELKLYIHIAENIKNEPERINIIIEIFKNIYNVNNNIEGIRKANIIKFIYKNIKLAESVLYFDNSGNYKIIYSQKEYFYLNFKHENIFRLKRIFTELIFLCNKITLQKEGML